jgi:hypothetical protein
MGHPSRSFIAPPRTHALRKDGLRTTVRLTTIAAALADRDTRSAKTRKKSSSFSEKRSAENVLQK